MLKYVRGETIDISPSTLGEGGAEHAKALIARHPELTLPEHKVALLQAVNERAEGVVVPLDE